MWRVSLLKTLASQFSFTTVSTTIRTVESDVEVYMYCIIVLCKDNMEYIIII